MASKFAMIAALVFTLAACAQQAPAPSPPPADQAAPAATPPAAGADRSGAAQAPPATGTEASKPAPTQAPPTPAAEAPPVSSANPSGSSAPAAKPAAPAKPVPRFREVTVPAGTEISVRLETPLASDKNAVEDAVRGTVTTQIAVAGVTAIPAGSEIAGTAREVRRSGRVKGRAAIAFRFERLDVRDESHSISTALVTREAQADRTDDVKKGAIGVQRARSWAVSSAAVRAPQSVPVSAAQVR
jgi:hypothetical protein